MDKLLASSSNRSKWVLLRKGSGRLLELIHKEGLRGPGKGRVFALASQFLRGEKERTRGKKKMDFSLGDVGIGGRKEGRRLATKEKEMRSIVKGEGGEAWGDDCENAWEGKVISLKNQKKGEMPCGRVGKGEKSKLITDNSQKKNRSHRKVRGRRQPRNRKKKETTPI